MEDKDRALLLSCPVISKEVLAQLEAVMDQEDMLFLQSVGIAKKFSKNYVLVDHGECIDSLIFLRKGLARCVETGTEGTEKTYLYITEGCFIADAGFFHRQPVLFQIRFMEDSEVLIIGRRHLQDVLIRPKLMLFITIALSLTSRNLAMQIEDAAFRTTEEKVCRTLFCLSGEECIRYKPHFTHQEIADLAGVHRVTVTNTLADLKRQGIIGISPRGNFQVADREKLKRKIFKII